MNTYMLTLALLLCPCVVIPHAGDLDLTFNGTGIVTTTFPASTDNQIRDMKIQSDGKIIVGGISKTEMGNYLFALARYLTNGALDNTFGTDGLVTTDFTGTNHDFGTEVLIQPDNKITLSGSINVSGLLSFALARYLTNGDLDASFGTNGLVTTTFASSAAARGAALQPDGKIILCGYAGNDFALARYNTNGSLDTSFNASGIMPGTQTTSFGIGSISSAFSVVIQPDGKIIVSGRSDAQGPLSYALARYNADGSLDTSFNSSGSIPGTLVTVFPGTSSDGRGLALQPDGKILLGGRFISDTIETFIVARYHIDGSLDTSFGSSGFVITSIGSDMITAANALILQPDGKFLVGGRARFSGDDSFAIARYLNNGILDNSFGSNGIVITELSGIHDSVEAFGIQTNGRIVAAGYAGTAPNDRFFAVARYLNDEFPPCSCPCQPIIINANQYGSNNSMINNIGITR